MNTPRVNAVHQQLPMHRKIYINISNIKRIVSQDFKSLQMILVIATSY